MPYIIPVRGGSMERTGHRMTVDTCKPVLAWICVHYTILMSQSFIHVSRVGRAQPKGFCCMQWHKDIYHSCAWRIGVT